MFAIRTTIGALAVMLTAGAALAGTGPLYVNAAATGANNGTSWQNAYTDLQSALDSATVNSEIWVAQGSYYPTRNAHPYPHPSFSLRTGVAIYGGFAGVETALAQRDPAVHPTILSGDLHHDDPADLTDNTSPVIYNSGSDATAVLDGFTVSGGGGRVGATDPNGFGGGFQLINSRAVITNCVISNTFISTVMDTFGPGVGPIGGGAYISGGAPSFINCNFVNNSNGRGISGPCQGGGPRPGAMPGGNGGGAYIENASPMFIACRFTNNVAGNGGNGINCSFSASGGGNGGNGGGVYATSSTPTFINCLFAHNAPGAGGAGTTGPDGVHPPRQSWHRRQSLPDRINRFDHRLHIR